MKTLSLSKIANDGWRIVKKNSPQILMFLGISGMAASVALAVTATPKAIKCIEEKKEEVNDVELTKTETIQAAWKCYIPAAATFGLSTACLVGAQSVNVRRNAALAAAYALSESALKEYHDKVVETIGDKKEQAIRDSISKDKAEKIDTSTASVVLSERGNTWCLDQLCNQLFKSDVETLRRAENELNRRMRSEMYVSLNEFYSEIGAEHTKIGDLIGWNIDRGYIDLHLSAQLTKDGVPCIVVGHNLLPEHDYDR